jgi:hypothetical protein
MLLLPTKMLLDLNPYHVRLVAPSAAPIVLNSVTWASAVTPDLAAATLLPITRALLTPCVITTIVFVKIV